MSQPNDNAQPRVVIIGGGITGLSAAHAFEETGIAYTLVECEARLGGKIRTDVLEHAGRYVVEAGPDSILIQKPWAAALARSLGLGERLIGSNQERKTVYILSHGRLVPMPEGLVLVVPTRLGPFLRSPLLSLGGRLRALLDLCLPRRRDAGDESLSGFIRRRMGQELLERMAEPLMGGIHNAECERQSLLATFPRFHAVERTHGSLIRGLRTETRQARAKAGGTRGSPFVSFPHGLQELVDALAAQLQGDIRLNCGVRVIERDEVHQRYRVVLEGGEVLEADAIVLATSARIAATLVRDMQPVLADSLAAIRYVSTATVSLAYRRAEVGNVVDGTGVLVPRVEKRQINAITMSSVKWQGRAPDDAVLIRVFVGGSHNPGILKLDDAALLAVVRAELKALVQVDAEPIFSHITRWNEANPQYDVGHLERVTALEALCPEGLQLAGCAYRGVGIPDCVQQGQDSAARIVNGFAQRAIAVTPESASFAQ